MEQILKYYDPLVKIPHNYKLVTIPMKWIYNRTDTCKHIPSVLILFTVVYCMFCILVYYLSSTRTETKFII